MKVVHLCLGAFFPDNYSYQENMLPRFHKELGYDVEVIASLESFDENGKGCYTDNVGTYFNEYGIKVTRLQYSFPKKVNHKLKHYQGVLESLYKAKPDIIFCHNCQFLSIYDLKKYMLNHPNVRLYVDNHADFSNSAKNWFSKNILHKLLWKKCAQDINPFVKKFYGVLPAREDFLVNVYGLPKEKVELLLMGVDDEKVQEVYENGYREQIRKKYCINNDDFLIMTGGKIDAWKTQTLLLMEAVRNIPDKRIKLIVFGSVTNDLKDSVNSFVDGGKIQYIGWIDSQDSYKYWAAADLVVFPGRHSVFWEQVAGMGIPMVCKYWEGTTHIDCGGNVQFLYQDTTEEIKDIILKIHNNCYKQMVEIAQSETKNKFSYRRIAFEAIN